MKTKPPFTNKQILNALKKSTEDQQKEWNKHPILTRIFKQLLKLTKDLK
jgi:hypothetical protein